MSQSYFDAIILGTDFEALICGALLTKRGYRVLLAGQDDLPPVYRAGEHSLPHHPFTFLAGHSPMARRIFAELALHQIFRRRAVAIDPPFQVAQPGHRLDLPLDEDERLLEIEREFPEVRRPVEDFHRSVAITSAEIDRIVERDLVWSPSSFLERRELSRAIAHQPFSRRGDVPDPLREIADDHPFRWVVEAPVRFASDLDPDQRPHLSTARLYTAWLHGAATVEGGYAWLRETLIDRIQTHGGEVRPRERAERILVRRGAAAGVRMARSGEEIGSGFVIFGAEVSRLLRLLDDRTPFEGVFERLGEPQARWFRYTLNLVVAAEGVPEGVARDVFFIRDRAQPLAGGNLLHVQAGAPDAAGLRALCVGALLPRRDLEDGRGYLEGIRERVLDSLGELMPFLTRHLHLLDSPHDGRPPRDVREGVDLGIAEPWTRGPAMMQAIHAHPVRGALGVCAMPVRMPIRRLLLCGRQVVPGLGMEGRLLAAWSAARIVTKADPRKEWMRGSLWSRLDI